MEDYAIKITNVKKKYRLGQIGGGTLTADLQSWWAKVRGKEDPNAKIGTEQRSNGETFMALNDVSLTVKRGEALGIIGGNGAGKSTLLKLLSRVTAPTEGEIDIYGRITSMLEVGTGFHGEMTGRENVYLNGAILGMTKAEVDAKMEDIIEFSEVREFIDTPVKRYSSGMYVKLAFSVAAHLDSEIMIMDEVLAVGDMAFQKKCLDKMRDAATKEGRTVLYVSHNMNTIRQLCDRCVVLDKGKIIFDGDVEEAITLYLGTEKSLSTQYSYDESYHSRKFATREIDITALQIKNKTEAKFADNELIPVTITCHCNKDISDIYFRIEIQYKDGSNAATALSKSSINFTKDSDMEILMNIDCSHLVPGRYKADIIAYTTNQFGNEHLVDGVYPGFMIEIEPSKENNIIWNHRYWGHTRLNDFDISVKETNDG